MEIDYWLYRLDLTNLTEAGHATAARLTDSQIDFSQVTDLYWFK